VHGAYRAEDGTPYLVAELLAGEALSVSMNRGPTAVGEAARIVQALLDALEAAHAVGVVHRDLKPDNVILEPGTPTKVRLLDFGMSRAVEAAGGSARRTKTGMLLGTPGYMSPEQVRNSKDADERSDLFSVGVLFFELITGQRAFDGGTEYERMMAVLFADARLIEKMAPQFAHWQPFFNKALHRDAENRFQSAAEMREALQSVAESGQMPKQRFGGDATALSPMGSEFSAADARKAPPVQLLILPRSLRLSWVVGLLGAAALLGFLLGFWVGGA
jgi:serine/threonine-protein kinase